MSAAWWGREATPAQSGRMVRGPLGAQPQLLPPDVAGIREAVRDRIAAFTPDWTNRREGDAGVALVRLFAFELEPVLRRANRTPEQAFVEYLVTAGVRPLPATPAATLLQLTVSPAADGPVFVRAGCRRPRHRRPARATSSPSRRLRARGPRPPRSSSCRYRRAGSTDRWSSRSPTLRSIRSACAPAPVERSGSASRPTSRTARRSRSGSSLRHRRARLRRRPRAPSHRFHSPRRLCCAGRCSTAGRSCRPRCWWTRRPGSCAAA